MSWTLVCDACGASVDCTAGWSRKAWPPGWTMGPGSVGHRCADCAPAYRAELREKRAARRQRPAAPLAPQGELF